MEKNIKNIEFNSPILSNIKKQTSNIDINTIANNGLTKYLDLFEKSDFFEKKELQKGSILFKEGDIDNNLYIVKKGLLSIEKSLANTKDTKQLATLKTGDFFGEGSIDKSDIKKEVTIKTIEDSQLLYIDGKNGLQNFIENNPIIGYSLLKHIIITTNQRLLESNKIITNNYEIDKYINSLKIINLKNVFGLIDKIKDILNVEYILYFEKHQIMESFLTLRYDSRESNKMQEKVFERAGYFLNLDDLFLECNVDKKDKIIVNKLGIGNEVFGYLILVRKNNIFNESDKKSFSSIANSLSGVIKKLFVDKEQRDKIYIEMI
ncbi:cyclic nucleotide-binding domain-containing protein [Candidatus Gracilibacteria bacterium]|nr:cyclic nucleotide-binding domain-containing protein [Candidatus Gracilibacteria bacterium]